MSILPSKIKKTSLITISVIVLTHPISGSAGKKQACDSLKHTHKYLYTYVDLNLTFGDVRSHYWYSRIPYYYYHGLDLNFGLRLNLYPFYIEGSYCNMLQGFFIKNNDDVRSYPFWRTRIGVNGAIKKSAWDVGLTYCKAFGYKDDISAFGFSLAYDYNYGPVVIGTTLSNVAQEIRSKSLDHTHLSFRIYSTRRFIMPYLEFTGYVKKRTDTSYLMLITLGIQISLTKNQRTLFNNDKFFYIKAVP